MGEAPEYFFFFFFFFFFSYRSHYFLNLNLQQRIGNWFRLKSEFKPLEGEMKDPISKNCTWILVPYLYLEDPFFSTLGHMQVSVPIKRLIFIHYFYSRTLIGWSINVD
ncbi:hypothetical protein ACN42_g7049 [Penicillium freii]|uniref:Uncharacterized protein n=1 Tax=Penicillium freii TaxID=48697 RepID=A0A101MGB9_PENFR|nr:hypothetical protein ACN42_g7049 [Penicillium freii]